MISGVQLSLRIGPVPLAAPREVTDALVSVKVMDGSGGTQSGFEMVFELPARSPLRTLFLLTGGVSGLPMMRIVLIVTINGVAQSIIDGVVTNVETQPGDGGVSRLVVKGKDLTALMDYIEFDGLPYPAMPPAARVLLVLAKYAFLGCIPLVIPSIVGHPDPHRSDTPPPGHRLRVRDCPGGRGRLRLLHRSRAGARREQGLLGPEIRIGVPQPALNAGLDGPHDNVTALNFTFDKEKKEFPVVFIQESTTKAPIPIPIPDITPLNPPLGAVPPLPPKIKFLKDTAKLNPLGAVLTGLSYAARHSDVVFATGSLDVARYGRVLKSRRLVGVRGAGDVFNGLYYVTR